MYLCAGFSWIKVENDLQIAAFCFYLRFAFYEAVFWSISGPQVDACDISAAGEYRHASLFLLSTSKKTTRSGESRITQTKIESRRFNSSPLGALSIFLFFIWLYCIYVSLFKRQSFTLLCLAWWQHSKHNATSFGVVTTTVKIKKISRLLEVAALTPAQPAKHSVTDKKKLKNQCVFKKKASGLCGVWPWTSSSISG